MRAEASCGNSLVLFLIFLFVAPMQAYANTQANLTMLQRAWIFAIYAEAATAIFCLLGLMWDDPGTIKRTAENCFPLPDIVAEKLANGQSLESVGNVTGEDGRVFCIRCLVWRPDDGGNTHHCSTCQRCVCEFDHHCGVRAARASLARNTWPPPDDASDLTPLSSPSLQADCLPHHGGKWADERSNASLFPPSAHAALAPCYAPAPPSTPPMPVSFPTFPTGLRPVHRGRRLRRQHGVLQNSHLDGRPRLRYVCLFDGRLERLDCRRPCMQVLTTAPSPHRYVRLFHGRLERPLRELPAPPSRLACLHPRLAWQHVLLGVERVPRPGAEPHDTLRTRTTCALRGPPPAHALTDRRSLG